MGMQCPFPVGACSPNDVVVSRAVVGLDESEPSDYQSAETEQGEMQQTSDAEFSATTGPGQVDDLSELLDLFANQP